MYASCAANGKMQDARDNFSRREGERPAEKAHGEETARDESVPDSAVS